MRSSYATTKVILTGWLAGFWLRFLYQNFHYLYACGSLEKHRQNWFHYLCREQNQSNSAIYIPFWNKKIWNCIIPVLSNLKVVFYIFEANIWYAFAGTVSSFWQRAGCLGSSFAVTKKSARYLPVSDRNFIYALHVTFWRHLQIELESKKGIVCFSLLGFWSSRLEFDILIG